MINTKGFLVNFHGDSSVGIFEQIWEINGEFHFEDEDEVKLFREKISEAFEIICGEATEVITFEENDKRKNQYKDFKNSQESNR